METHPDPKKALSDGMNSLPLDSIEKLLITLKRIDEASKE
jgi:2-dehydro-3-deoxyphosphooctonate aldolase (KDO 8-P synthase)